VAFVQLTRPDGSAVAIKTDEVLKFAPVPTAGPLMGPLSTGTRITFRNGTHQDVKELEDEVLRRCND
jgi:hypothetical protein